jgi:Tol biopolymer transport system component
MMLFGPISGPTTNQESPVPVRFNVMPPPDGSFLTPVGGGTGSASQMALSPDGRQLVFVASTNNRFNLWVRPLGAVEPRLLAGTEGAAFPFWSPDSRTIGFFAQGKLKRVSLDGGAALVLCDATGGRGGTWNQDNVIVFSANTTGQLHRVSAAGGVPVPVTTLDSTYGETSHRFPFFLPDGRHFLFTASVGTCCPAAKAARVKIGVLDSMDAVELFSGLETSVTYASGHVLFNRNGVLMAQPFETQSRQFTGEPFPVAESVSSEGSRYAGFSASNTGTLVYAAGTGRPLTRLTWFDRGGTILDSVGDAAIMSAIALSRDDRRIAAVITSGTPENRDIWLADTSGGPLSRLTFDSTNDNAPMWSPDSKAIAYESNPKGFLSLMRKPADGGPDEELVPGATGVSVITSDWSADGRYLLFTRIEARPQGSLAGTTDLWVLPLFGERKPIPFAAERNVIESAGAFSPDVRWVAYVSNESGTPQINVRPFPSGGARWQVSVAGGTHPVWSADQQEILFLGLDGRLMSAGVRTAGASFERSEPRTLFLMPTLAINGVTNYRQFAVSRDGKRILANLMEQRSATTPLTVVVNWLSIPK